MFYREKSFEYHLKNNIKFTFMHFEIFYFYEQKDKKNFVLQLFPQFKQNQNINYLIVLTSCFKKKNSKQRK